MLDCCTISINNISKHRNSLMGIAILNVMIWHLLESYGIHNYIICCMTKMIYTPGFFFLSSFGLYYSFSHSPQLYDFYKKRFLRLFLPYLIIVTPFMILMNSYRGTSCFETFLDILTISFWVKGNYLGIWYIVVSMVLYAMFPIFYKIIFCSKRYILLRAIFVTLLYAGITIKANQVNSNVEMWFIRSILFPVGIYFGYLSQKEIALRCTQKWLLLSITLCVLMYFRNLNLLPFVSIVLLSEVLESFNGKEHIMHNLLDWLGQYTLELYLLHIFIAYSLYVVWGLDLFVAFVISEIISVLFCQYTHNYIQKLIKI